MAIAAAMQAVGAGSEEARHRVGCGRLRRREAFASEGAQVNDVDQHVHER